MSEWRELADIAAIVSRSRPGELALATLVASSGSTYRKPGARVVLHRDGAVTGAISGGCIDSGLYEIALDVFATGRPRIVRYDTGAAADTLFGSGSGCGGALEIVIEPVTESLQAQLESFATPSNEPLFAVLARTLEDRPSASRFLPRERLPLALRRAAAGAERGWAEIRHMGEIVRVERIAPLRRLTIFGASPTCSPLIEVAAATGWRVHVAESRPAMLEAMRSTSIERRIGGAVDSLAERADPPPGSAVVVMTHRLDLDRQILFPLLQRPLRYLGLLGSADRSRRLASELGATMPPWFHAPAGIDLGGETPEQIALSVLAEIETVFNGGSRERLRRREGPIHDRAFSGELAIAVLAAGGSSRFGRPKQLAMINGVPLMSRAVDAALSQSGTRVLVVIDPAQETVHRSLAGLRVAVLPNGDAGEGIASSIRLAARTAMQLDAAGLLILLADQPWIGRSGVEALVETWRSDPAAIHASGYAEGAGVPALFPRSCLEDLLTLQGDEGARELLRGRAFVVKVQRGSNVRDIDTTADLDTGTSRVSGSGIRF